MNTIQDQGSHELPADHRIPPVVEQAQKAFQAALPQLLRERPGQWVAFHGDRQVGFGASKTGLYQECFALGLRRGELLVRLIQPQVEVIALDPRTMG
jgi:hypothetical protein